MSDQASDLSRLENWMHAVITHPQGVESGVACEVARRHIDVSVGNVESVVTRSNALAAVDRLAIYSRAYHARLLECLRAEFPVLLHALGGDLFNRFAFDYLEKYPSRTYTLARLGERFPRYLAETRPGLDMPHEARENWPDFIIDLATLERQFSEVFDGPGVEGRPLVTENQLGEMFESERWAEVRLITVPCLRTLSFRYPVNDYFLAVRRNDDPGLPEPADSRLAVTRRDYRVFLYDLSRQQYELLSGLIAGESVAKSIRRAAPATDCDTESLAANAHKWLANWAVLGFFSATEVRNAIP